ncbi:MAG: hypothetical protein N3G78_12070 [Desulfobacterota bacterium]|nr:hypothetical protein [Thermodesulfobacteriota bacterium]
MGSQSPYSPKKTCGACHDYDQITKGYHFQQGRLDGSGKIAVSDTFDPQTPGSLSSGLYGKYSPLSPDASLLSRKTNRTFSEMDRSTFFYVRNCGPCHPGGGWAEFDRRGNPYYDPSKRKFGYEFFGEPPHLDGDYTPFSGGHENYGAPWDRSGVNEADCLICHLPGYRWKERAAFLRAGLFRYGPAAGAGWATFKPPSPQTPEAQTGSPRIDYTNKEVADFENLHVQIVRRPPSENCWSCHAPYGEKKRGYEWSPETDVHRARGMECVSCHPGNKEHQIAKGDSLSLTVRDDLDQTMPSCEDCHYKRRDRKAPRPRHPFSPRHLRRIACQTCHLPYRSLSAELVYDHTTGETRIYETSDFIPSAGARSPLWYPGLRNFKGKIVPVKPALPIYWGDLDEKRNVVRPIPLWKIREMKKPPLRDDNGDGVPEVNSLEEIRSFLLALKGRDRFGNPIAELPVLLKGGFLYRLDKKGAVEKIPHDRARPTDLSLNHNVRPGSLALGAKGCKECHVRNSPFFLRKILVDPYDEKGKAVYVEAWEWMGIERERLGRLLLEQ